MGKLYDVCALKKALPEWSQRLMLDRAEIIDETHAVAVKNLTNNEEFFNGDACLFCSNSNNNIVLHISP